MALPLRPELRPLEIVPYGPEENMMFILRDPQGYGRSAKLHGGAVILAGMMDGQRTLSEIRSAFQSETGFAIAMPELEEMVRRLDKNYLLLGERFDRYRREREGEYLGNPLRPPSHAGDAYEGQPEALRRQLAGFFTAPGGPGAVDTAATPTGGRLCGVISPHIDLHRGGPTTAWAYKQVAEHSDADLFVIFGTSHDPMEQLFGVTRKDFEVPLGVVQTDQRFIDRLAEHLASSTAGQQIDLLADELVHRFEHSIEFQAVFLQYVLGNRREFRIVPVLVASFHDFMAGGLQPDETPEVQAFLSAMRAAVDQHSGRVCYVSAADFAHIGRHFGDAWPVDEKRLAEQSADDRKLLEAACRCDAAGFFSHVAAQQDRSRICGLSPTYTMLALMESTRGELLKYHQALEADGSSCVSFASVAFRQQ